MLGRIVIAFMVAVCLLAASTQSTQAQVNWDPECAIEAAQQFAACKAAGGKPFGCLVKAGFFYWQCSGSTIPATRLRAARLGARAVLRSR
jgi:hypothetical protein